MSNSSLIKAAFQSDVPLLRWGPPGVGKTAEIDEVMIGLGAHVETIIGSTMDPTDIARPIVVGQEVHLAADARFRRLKAAVDAGKPAVLFMDEFTCIPPLMQAALLRVVNERQAADLDLTGVRMIAAANPTDLATGGWELAAATTSRWLHIDHKMDIPGWLAGEAAGWGNANRTERHAFWSSRITGFLERNPSALLDPPKDGDNIRGWPCPRTWSKAAQMLACVEAEDRSAVLSGMVGAGAGGEFLNWLASDDLPDPRELLKDFKLLPKRGDRVRAAVDGCIAYSMQDESLRDKTWELIQHIATKKKDARVDVAVALGRHYFRTARVAKVELGYPDAARELVSKIREANSY